MNLSNEQNWNLLRRASYEVGVIERGYGTYTYLALPDVQVIATSPILMIGVNSSKALKHWKLGAWVSMWLPILPSSTTNFTATVRSDTQRCYLRQLNLIRFPQLGINSFFVNISFPYWLEQADLEVWQYGENTDGSYTPPASGPSGDAQAIAQALGNVESRLDQLAATVQLIANQEVTTQYDVDPG